MNTMIKRVLGNAGLILEDGPRINPPWHYWSQDL